MCAGICTALQEHCRGPTPSQGSDTGGGGLGFLPCDAYAACVLEEPAIVVGSRDLFCGVELGGTMARGLSYFDWYGQLKDGQVCVIACVRAGCARVHVVRALDMTHGDSAGQEGSAQCSAGAIFTHASRQGAVPKDLSVTRSLYFMATYLNDGAPRPVSLYAT